MLTPTQFEALLDRHGSDLSKWPRAERDQAGQLLQTDTAAKALLDQHRQFATLLDSVPRISASANLRRAVAEVPLQPQTKQSPLLRAVQWLLGDEGSTDSAATVGWGGRLPQAALAAAALSVGIGALSGVALETYDTEPPLDETALAAEGDDLSALAFAEDLDVQW